MKKMNKLGLAGDSMPTSSVLLVSALQAVNISFTKNYYKRSYSWLGCQESLFQDTRKLTDVLVAVKPVLDRINNW